MGRLKFKGNSISGFGVELWNQLKGKPFETLKSADFNVSGGELQIKDKVTPAQLNAKANQADVTSLSETIAEQTDNGYLFGGQLLDKSTFEVGTPKNTDGSINKDDVNFRTSGFIEIKPNTEYYFENIASTKDRYGIYWFDSFKTFISRDGIWTSTSLASGSKTAPSNAKYVRVTTPKDYVDSCMLNEGSEALPYAPYSKSNIALTREAQDLEASNFLGWGMPSEAIEQGLYNYVSGDVCHQRVGRVDLENITWRYNSTDKFFETDNLISGYSWKFVNKGYNSRYTFYNEDVRTAKSQCLFVYNGKIFIKDTQLTTGAELKNALATSGKYLYYELATEQLVTTQLSDEIANHENRLDILEEKVKRGTIYGFHVNSNQSNPSNAVTYLKDAVGMTPAHMDYTNARFDYGSWRDAFFMPRPCMLKFDGTVDYYLDENDFTKKADGTASDVSNVNYDGNAMIEWGRNGKRIYYKIVADLDNPTSYSVYIADNEVDSTFKCWSFINNQNRLVDHFYTPIYNGSLDSNNRLRSLSGQTIMDSKSATAEIGYAKANNMTEDVLWYTETFADCTLINLLLILMGKSLDTQTVYGQGHTSGGQSTTQGQPTGTLDKKGMFFGSNLTTQQVKVFGMENYWGHQYRRIAGLMNSQNNFYYKMTYGNADGSNLNEYGTSISGMLNGGATPSANGYQSKNKVINGDAILPSVNGGSSSTHYCDYNNNSTSTTYAVHGGDSSYGSGCGAFCDRLDYGVDLAYWFVGTSVSCKPLV